MAVELDRKRALPVTGLANDLADLQERLGRMIVAQKRDGTNVTAADVKAAFDPLYRQLDHHYLNDVPGLDNPTSEVMAAWLYRELAASLAGLAWVEVRETHTAGSQFDGQTYRIWKEQHFESAVPFDAAGNYTFWDYQAGAWQRDHGIRIDFHLLSPQAADRFRGVETHRDARDMDKPSNHVPVVVELED